MALRQDPLVQLVSARVVKRQVQGHFPDVVVDLVEDVLVIEYDGDKRNHATAEKDAKDARLTQKMLEDPRVLVLRIRMPSMAPVLVASKRFRSLIQYSANDPSRAFDSLCEVIRIELDSGIPSLVRRHLFGSGS